MESQCYVRGTLEIGLVHLRVTREQFGEQVLTEMLQEQLQGQQTFLRKYAHAMVVFGNWSSGPIRHGTARRARAPCMHGMRYAWCTLYTHFGFVCSCAGSSGMPRVELKFAHIRTNIL